MRFYLINGYNIIRKDRPGKKRGGGVLIALRENIPYNIVLPSNAKRDWHDLLEIVAIEIQLNKNSKKALLCVCYRSQKYKTESWSQMFTEFLQDTQNYVLILITGDFNFPELTWNSTLVASRPVSAHSVEFRELTLDFFLEQTNTHSTRGDNILDLVFSRTPEAIKDLTCICPKNMNISSDHGLLQPRSQALPSCLRKDPGWGWSRVSRKFDRPRGSRQSIKLHASTFELYTSIARSECFVPINFENHIYLPNLICVCF